MSQFRRAVIAIIFFSAVIWCGVNAAEDSKEKPFQIVWFDGAGLYHSSDPLPYLNDVLSGKVKDPEIQTMLTVVCKDKQTVTHDDIAKIADFLDPLKHTAAFYPLDEARLAAQQKIIRDHFASTVAATGSLNIKSLSFIAQGDVSKLTGAPDTNLLLAIPADPVIIGHTTIEVTDSGFQLEQTLVKAARESEWSSQSQQSTVAIGGVSTLLNLKPGPWIVYLNQKDLITQCYRVLIPSEGKKELVADKPCAPPRIRFTWKGETESQGS